MPYVSRIFQQLNAWFELRLDILTFLIYHFQEMWNYEFYQDEEGQEPVKDFLLSLPSKHRGKVLQTIQILSEFGINLPYSVLVWGLKPPPKQRPRKTQNFRHS